MAVSKKNARTLAVSYNAFMSESEPMSAGYWAETLLTAQKATGVELCKPDMLQRWIDDGRRAWQAKVASEVGESAVQLALASDTEYSAYGAAFD